MTTEEIIEKLEKEIECEHTFNNGGCRFKTCVSCGAYVDDTEKTAAMRAAIKVMKTHKIHMTDEGSDKGNYNSNENVAANTESEGLENAETAAENEENDAEDIMEELLTDIIVGMDSMMNVFNGKPKLDYDDIEYLINSSFATTKKLFDLQRMECAVEAKWKN